MIGVLLTAMAATPAIEVVVPNPSRSLPAIERFLTAARFADGRLDPATARTLADGFVDPLSLQGLTGIGIDTKRPFRLVRPTPDERFLLISSLADAKKFETYLQDQMVANKAKVHDGIVVLGSKARWQTLLKRKRNTLYTMRATRSLGIAQVNVDTLVAREKKPMEALIRGAPRKWQRPAGLPRGRDVYVRADGTAEVTAFAAALALDERSAKANFRFELDALRTVSFGDLIGRRPAKRLLTPAKNPAAIELWANVPSNGRAEVLRQLSLPGAIAKLTTGVIEIALETNGDVTFAVELINPKAARTVAEGLSGRYPDAKVGIEETVVLLAFGTTVRRSQSAFHKTPDPFGLRVVPSALFASLAGRSRATDGAGIDGMRLGVFRFAYGGLRRLGQSLTINLSRARKGFIGNAHLIYAPPG